MESNLTLRSNIYINKTCRNDDAEFLRHITDYRVLRDMQENPFYCGYGGIAWFTPLQQEILRQGQPSCSLEQDTMSWGVPVGGDHMVCRCEQYDCRRYPWCSQYLNFEAIHREEPAPIETETAKTDTPPLDVLEEPWRATPALEELPDVAEEHPQAVRTTMESVPHDIGETSEPLDESAETAPAMLDGKEPTCPEEWTTDISKQEPPEPEDVQAVAHFDESAQQADIPVQLVEQSTILEADVRERIWVNAGPGTGKTYVVIARLKKLLEEGVDGTILVLCFSRSAVQLIRERLTDAMGARAGNWLNDEKLIIRTFDSFASYMLADELDPSWDYDRRIAEFIEMLGRNPGVLNGLLGYLIVDEIQDTVGVRARMLLAMLDELKCGALLLGDQCQAIFDWTVRCAGEMDFDALAMELMRRNIRRIELEGNRRQTKELASAGASLRECMISEPEDAQEAEVGAFKQWIHHRWSDCTIKKLPEHLDGAEDLVLCKTNGAAAYISQRLFESARQPDHVLKQSLRHITLAPWIAKVLVGNDGRSLSREAFMKNAQDWEVEGAEEKWAALKSLDGHPRAPTLHIPELLCALRKAESLPSCCVNRYEDCAVVSTIHRAKGSEASHVYWLDEPLVYETHQHQDGALSDSVRAAYVAATRARKEIHLLKPDKQSYVRSIDGNRWIQTGYSHHGNPYCKGLALQPEDTDMASFASGSDAADRQMLLACLLPGAPVTIYPDEGNEQFEIYCDGQLIGMTAPSFRAAMSAGINATNHSRSFPPIIPDVYISAIVTVIDPGNPRVDPRYATAGCWLGVELGGLPRFEWNGNS